MKRDDRPKTVLFVFAWLVVGGEETEVRLLAANLDRSRFRIDVVACLRKDNMPDQTHQQLKAVGIDVDTTPYTLSFEDTVAYLADKIPAYDVVVSCQNVADIYPALERLKLRPPLIEHGGLVLEALGGPKHFTSRYVGVCRTIRDAAASRMPGREHHALEIPSMVDLREFNPLRRLPIRRELGIKEDEILVGWIGRLDPKKNVETFIHAASIIHDQEPRVRFVIVGGPDAFMPEYAQRLRAISRALELDGVLRFLGDRTDVPDILAALDVFVWLSRDEGMPHVIAEAGAAGLPVVATADNGSKQQIEHGVSGYFVAHDDPQAVADNVSMLARSPDLRGRLGRSLRAHVEMNYSAKAVVPLWEALFDEVIDEKRARGPSGLFLSFFQGGFECSTHHIPGKSGTLPHRRLDVIASTQHDQYAEEDYRQLMGHGIRTVRDGFRWHLIERSPGRYTWDSALSMISAGRRTGTQIIWDLLHYGWPDDIDLWSPAFVERFSMFAGAAAALVRAESDGPIFFCPVNEISFFSWAGGDAAYLNPWATRRGFELKVQLVRASIASMKAILDVDPQVRFVHCEPAINVVADPGRTHEKELAEGHRLAQYQAWDMISGRSWPQLGGRDRYLDVVGVNYYYNNQWVHGGGPIDVGHPLHKPLRKILVETYARYGRPMLIAETGIEGDRRPDWLQYVAGEVRAAMKAGVPIEGVCLYPILNHSGWDDDRHCENGLLSMVRGPRGRKFYLPLARQLKEEAQVTRSFLEEIGDREKCSLDRPRRPS
ncbi:glycosyltransferase [Ensifer sp.]|uniref:glycosyltransferase family 4 protein n=1 Tax=Ensifer sp. TaxID=1872086 RepID=UPI00289F2CE6|nr:glycosyltransferase [Ensifer sp.]